MVRYFFVFCFCVNNLILLSDSVPCFVSFRVSCICVVLQRPFTTGKRVSRTQVCLSKMTIVITFIH